MVVILACLSLILTAGGGAMALYGADLIRSESGLALIQSGIMMLSAGLVLAGLTTAVSELRRMRRLMELEEPVPVFAAAPPPVLPAVDMTARPAPLAPVEPAPAPAASAGVPEPAVPAERPAEPVLAGLPKESKPDRPVPEPGPRPSLPPLPEGRRPAGSGIPAEAKASLVGIKARQPAAASVPAGTSPAEPPHGAKDTVTAPGGADGPDLAKGAPPAAESTAGQGLETMASPASPEAPGAEPGERKMLATYNSGGITYFMFSDGSIEADMTGGRHRFTSMDELRGYIDTGKGGVLVEPAPARDAG